MNNKNITKDIVVIYHDDCTDGFSAAWAAWKKFGEDADYVGINPGTAPIEGLEDKEIYMVDLIFPIEYLNNLIATNKKLVAIDHHISNQESFELIKNGIFDINHSGAVLSWNYFHPEIKVPRLLKHVEDMDLWKFEVPNTKEMISHLEMVDFDFIKWSEVVEGTEDDGKYKEYLASGSLILKYKDLLIGKIINSRAVKVDFLGHNTYAVNSPVFNSQIANTLSRKFPPMGIVWVQESDGSVHVSLRSDGTVDVSELSARFKDGGGHKKSAGFSVEDCSKLPWKKIDSDNNEK